MKLSEKIDWVALGIERIDNVIWISYALVDTVRIWVRIVAASDSL